ncbi:MAG TPA: GNAT family N-acetyltransferase [Nocardioidaceae bacterium]|nr:GNAT family N-acetyltransferase [Nocardioidaceae bacterium]
MSDIDIEIRVASFDELEPRASYRLWQLRESVFVVEQSCPYQELDGRDLDSGTRHVWAEHDGTPVGYLRLLEDDGQLRIGRVLVARHARGQGIAERLMHTALELVGQRPARLDAQSYLASWYGRFGFAQTGAEFLDDGIPHVPMSRPV